MIKNEKKLKENCNFPFLGFFFAPLEAKMMKTDKKNDENEKMKKNEKNMILKMIKKWYLKW